MKRNIAKKLCCCEPIVKLRRLSILKKYILFLSICYLLFCTPLGAQAASNAVSTFQSVGLYWNPSNGSTNNECEVLYRKVGDTNWREALSLWFDARNKEYRGSIVNLSPGTKYEVKLTLLSSSDTVTLTTETWNESFPIATTVYLPESSNRTLSINQSGTSSGYVLYTHNPGKTATIDVNNGESNCINIGNFHHVIIRGLNLKGASTNAIIMGTEAHDIIIEGCDISGWGRKGSSFDAGIRSTDSNYYSNVSRIIIQRNEIHHPRWPTNSWINGSHPYGAMAVVLTSSRGNHVIRYNSVYGDENHSFEDAFSGWDNFSRYGSTGFPAKDSDIYGNYISHCWDDSIESEGANENVRIWGNYLKTRHHAIGTFSTSVGPLYIFRNIIEGTETSTWGDYPKGGFIKTGNDSSKNTGGVLYVFHNSMLIPPYSGILLGVDMGLGGGYNNIDNLTSRNNILYTKGANHAICDRSYDAANNFDYDLFNGDTAFANGNEAHGISNTAPLYDATSTYNLSAPGGAGTFTLKAGSPGQDDGVVIPNFSDGYKGTAPDMGAHEQGSNKMEFGVSAYLGTSGNTASEPAPPINLMVVSK